MPQYFETFPKRLYDIANTGNDKVVTDIFRRLKVSDGIKDNLAMFASYDIQDGDTPESISYKHFGSTDYFWVICLMNDITDRFYDWPLTNSAFEDYVRKRNINLGALNINKKTKQIGPKKVEDLLITNTK